MRIGFGLDVHKLVEDRKLILGGVEIPHDKGLLGHSDADVLIHAIMDSICGALCLGDIGKLFPDTDMKYKDIDSRVLLRKVLKSWMIWVMKLEILILRFLAKNQNLEITSIQCVKISHKICTLILLTFQSRQLQQKNLALKADVKALQLTVSAY